MSKEIIASGKTKRVFRDENPDFVILEAIDRLTAGDAAKVASIESIGALKTTQCANIFRMFEEHNIATCFYDQPAPNQLRCKAVEMLPLEMVMRRYPYGSFLKRRPDLKADGKPMPMKEPVREIFHKAAVIMPPLVEAPLQISENDARDRYLKDDGWPEGVYTDPFVKNNGARWEIHDAKKPVDTPLMEIDAELSEAEIDKIWNDILIPAFSLLEEKLAAENIALVDIKFEIGRLPNGEYVLADVVDNDSWRIWPDGDPKAQLDKQGFREGDATDSVLTNYKIVTDITNKF